MSGILDIQGQEVLTTAQMYRADAAAVAAGVPSLSLMEAAGYQVAREIRARWPRQRVAVLCGPGNNGGDGFVVARLLRKAGWPVRVGLLGDAQALKGDAAVNAARWHSVAGSIETLSADLVGWAGLAVDALFGAGLTRPLDGLALETVETLRKSAVPCVSIDVPSGIDGDTGRVLGGDDGIAPASLLTVTFFRPKPAHALLPGRDMCGDLVVADIGIPEAVLDSINPQAVINGPGVWSLPTRGAADHKYTRGHAVVFGSETMSGAACLAASAARRAGAGLVTAIAPAAARSVYLSHAPGLMFEGDGTAQTALADPRRNAVLVGPGYGIGPETCGQVTSVLAQGRATVVDADGLTSFSSRPEELFSAIQAATGDVVLTPHEGEFGSLFGKLDDKDKLSRARDAAKTSGAVVVLKGSDTVIAAPDGRVAMSVNAPPWLATAGSGDVLSGLICGLLAQGMPAWEAACAGVWLHGEAGLLAGQGLIAEDLLTVMPQTIQAAIHWVIHGALAKT